MHVSDSDMPRLFQTTDETAKREQKHHKNLTRWSLSASLLSAALASVAVTQETVRLVMTLSTTVLLIVTIFLFFMIRNRQHDKKWYEARAMAESTKSLAWLYMTRAKPFHEEDTAAGREFESRLGEILAKRRHAVPSPPADRALPPISDRMLAVRGAATAERLDVYLKQRLQHQLGWYGDKARSHEEAERKGSNRVLLFYFLALVSALVLIVWPTSAIRTVGLFTTLASSVLAWMGVGRPQELARSYAWTAEQLSLLQSRSRSIATDEELAEFVQEAENVIFKEHALWVARRE